MVPYVPMFLQGSILVPRVLLKNADKVLYMGLKNFQQYSIGVTSNRCGRQLPQNPLLLTHAPLFGTEGFRV